MSGYEPLVEDPAGSAERIANKIAELEPDLRSDAIWKAGRLLYAGALAKGRTEAQAGLFARRMRQLIEEAVQRIVARGGGRRT